MCAVRSTQRFCITQLLHGLQFRVGRCVVVVCRILLYVSHNCLFS
jgi:hypothetical protein